jgi:hypothetical protein
MYEGVPPGYDFFYVTQANSTNPTWPTGNGGRLVAAAPDATVLTGGGRRVVLHSITAVGNPARNSAGDIRLLKGDASGFYGPDAATEDILHGANNNSPGYPYDIIFSNGLCIVDFSAAPAGGLLVAYLVLP